MRKLTKREAIDLHKEMWNFIVKNSEEKDSDSLEFSDERADLKTKFIQIALSGEKVLNDCFACEYANQQLQKYYKKNPSEFDVDGNYCKYCPIDWCRFCTKKNRDQLLPNPKAGAKKMIKNGNAQPITIQIK